MRCLRKIKEQNDRIADDNDDDSAIDVAPTRIEMHCDNLGNSTFLHLKGHCIEFKYYADGIHSGLTPPGNNS